MRLIKNIDYLSYNISDLILEEIQYKLKLVTIPKDSYVFKAGKICQNVIFICTGEIEIYINNNEVKGDSHLDTLYSGCSIGAYSSLIQDNYTISGRAKSDCVLLELPMVEFD